MKIDPQIIFEDDSLIVINKPSGIVVNRADTTVKVETIQDWADRKFQISNFKFQIQNETTEEFLSRSGVVHRLDKDTSGLLVIAKTPESFELLKNQFKGREVVKKYLTLVHGRVEPPEGTINAPIERNPFNRMHFGVFPGGREASTKFKVIKLASFKSQTYSLLEVEPKTGRTHQIRVHMKYISHPVVSDPLYVGRKTLREDLKFCPRLFLHAVFLQIAHPQTGKVLQFDSPLPTDLQQVLDSLSEVD